MFGRLAKNAGEMGWVNSDGNALASVASQDLWALREGGGQEENPRTSRTPQPPESLLKPRYDCMFSRFILESITSGMFIFPETVSQPLTETWKTGLKVFRQFPSDMDSTPCEMLLIKTARLVQEKLVKVETLERYIYLKSLLSGGLKHYFG